MSYKHGVYVSEQETSLTTPIEGTAGLQVIIGTAPVNLAEDPTTAMQPKLVYSFKEAVAALGYSDDWEKYTICQSMDACFRVFAIAPIIMLNVLDPAKHTKTNAAKAVQISNGAATYDVQDVLLSSVVVKSSDDATTYVKDTDYTLEFTTAGEVKITILPTGAAAEATAVKVNSTSIDPTLVTETDVIGGTDATTGKETGIEAVRLIYPMFAMTPGLLLAPGWSQKATVAAAMQAKTEGINGVYSCECLIDLDCSDSGCIRYSNLLNAKAAAGATNKHTAALWPMLSIGEKHYRYSAVFGALTAYTDANNSDVPNLSPSNRDTRTTSVILEDGTPVLLDQEQANFANSVGVITALPVSGVIKAWGNNTAAYPTNTDPKDRWFATRRFFTWRGNSFILTYFQKVDNPANTRLIENICDSENINGNALVAAGACAGYRITFLAKENPITAMLDGTIKFHMYLAPYVPAENIENVLEFDPTMLEEAMSGVAE